MAMSRKGKTWAAASVVAIFVIYNVGFSSVFFRHYAQGGKKINGKKISRPNGSLLTEIPAPTPLPIDLSTPMPSRRTERPTAKPSTSATILPTDDPNGAVVNRNKDRIDESPTLVLHIGPHKTGTSTIQCDLSHFRGELYADASVAYIGRVYGHCINPSVASGPVFDTRGLINTCFKSSLCTNTSLWRNLEAQLHHYANHNKSVIISDEAFSRMGIIVGDSVDNRIVLYRLLNKYYPGRVRVVVMYRRYYEWMQSMWNEGNKPHKNFYDPVSPYKEKFQKWPSEGGKTCKTFLEYITRKHKKVARDKLKWSEYQKLAEIDNIHVAEYLRRLWKNHSSNVVMLNMHEMEHKNDGEDITTLLLRENLSLVAGDVLRMAKANASYVGRPNPSKNFDYDRLAVKAHERGLLVNQSATLRFEIAQIAEKYLLQKLNKTKDSLPFVCLNQTHLESLLQKSLQYEREIYPDLSEEATKHHEEAFFKAFERKKFCNFDTDKLIEDNAVQNFFTKDIPQLLDIR
ncbi:unnamed protein product [Pseudo-nitzschia multistriata]|uniref:Sulfotransferase domain-containing protein n=1 Tax=Pseudo-nitzschia multistriata TaxID=183589 RepID=A0A448ZRR7_9STRA|nr:unnamed protein product [Pseudo-nitzschia multistriata]